jgi:glycosyltransferase involved in cell wall biosynthesis
MMKKVCHVVSGHARDNNRIFSRQCISLVNSGFDVFILTNDGKPNQVIEGVKIISTVTYYTSRIKVILKAKDMFISEAININADIYQLHGPELIPLGLALKKLGKIIIYDAHEDLPKQMLDKEWVPYIFRLPLSILTRIYFKYTLSRFDEIVTVTDHIAVDLKLINPNTTILPNFPIIGSTGHFHFEDYVVREKVICYTGTVYKQSNQHNIVRAINDLQNVKYYIAGTVDKKLFEEMLILDNFKKINYFGLLPKNELPIFYSKALVGILVQDYEQNMGYNKGTLGSNKFFEYMEAGLPIICTDYDLWKKIVEKYVCGICVQPGNVKQIREAIDYIMNNPMQAFQMGQNGRNAVLTEYNWEQVENIYIAIFKKYLE